MTALHIMLHGLIALVPLNDSAGKADHMMALVVDSSIAPSVAADCLAEHKPLLSFVPKNEADCTGGCTMQDNRCVCTLNHDLISLLIEPEFTPPTRVELSRTPDSSLPFNKQAAADFSYIANLSQEKLGRHAVDQGLLETPIPARDPQYLIGRMEFPFTSVQACGFATRPAEGGKNVHALGFRPLRAVENPGDLSQAVAQGAVAHLMDLPEDSTVKIHLAKFDQASPRDIELSAGPDGFEIELTNMRPKNLEPRIGDPCDDGVGRDFAFFYNLLPNPPAWEQRLIPHVKFTQWKSALDVDLDCQVTKDPNSRPICPMASFN